MSTTLNLPLEVIPFDRAISVRTFLRPLTQHLQDPRVTEIAIVREGHLYARTDGHWVSHDCEELSYPHLEALATALAAYNHMARSPIMSVVLPDGERGQIILPPACIDGTIAINIRKHATETFHLKQLASGGAFKSTMDATAKYGADGLSKLDQRLLILKNRGDYFEFLVDAVRERKNIVISGATGSGKTTFARSLMNEIPVHERLITIEDVHELILPWHKNRVHMMYGGSRGRVSATDCLAACMRLSPDRIFLAELRGPETWDYLAALNTGHPGSITTTHANSALDAFDRLAILTKQSPTGGNLDLPTIQTFLQQTVDIVVHVEKFRVQEIWFEPRRHVVA